MYITIVFLPFLAAILSGLFGRVLGIKGVYIINITCLLITTLLSFIAFYEVVISNSPISIELFSWISSEHLKVTWSFYFDELTVSMLIPVLIVSVLVHFYSVGYMGEDPHSQRFFSYISLFTGLMLILVTGNNFLVMFVGWEGVGICSYLLVHFWYTRVAAVKSAMNAMFTNRVGDFFLTIGFFAIFFTFGTLDYATVFSLAPYININVITFIAILLLLGAAAKSAQIGLHIWLPFAMEGWVIWLAFILLFINYLISVNVSGLFPIKIRQIKFSYINYASIKYSSVNVKREKPLIWVYNINNLSLVRGAPFKTKTECAKILHINRSTVAAYLNSDKLFNYKWIFNSSVLSKEELSKWLIPVKVMEIITGELLGDGHIRYNPKNFPKVNGRLAFTFSTKILYYVEYLKYEALGFICTKSKPTPWPNPLFSNKEPTQYWFSSKQLPILSELHHLWYKEIDGKYKKKIPDGIEEMLTPVGLAHWIMGDGYYGDGAVKICTDNFTQEEVLKLIKVLDNKFEIKSSINRRKNPNGNIVWRIRVRKLSMEKLKKLVIPYFIPEMLYKLGIKK
jgi:LAGLIDADG DNA endonuclease family/Proton-conducting membrane transporter/NADH-Ubiquinone oxidoreductase (complex I), chain 5 N-terminus/NUMOD1 domain